MQFDELEPVEVLAAKVRHCIDNALGEDLLTCLKAADTYLWDRKELMYDAYFAAGEFKTTVNDADNSILLYNKARKYNPYTIIVFEKIVDSLIAYYYPNKKKFIKSDLIGLVPPNKGLIDFYNKICPDRRRIFVCNGLPY